MVVAGLPAALVLPAPACHIPERIEGREFPTFEVFSFFLVAPSIPLPGVSFHTLAFLRR